MTSVQNYLNLYKNFLVKFLKLGKPFKVVFDCSNGTAGPILKKLLKANELTSLRALLINDEPDGNFPAHGPDPWAPRAMNQLQKAVLKNKADLGAIFDADGDRVFFVDNLGRPVASDVVSRLLTWHLKPNKVVVDVRTGWLVKSGQMSGVRCQIVESRVGHYFIKQVMRKNKAELGTEFSGHYYFKDFFYLDSGIFAAIQVMNAVSRLPYRLSDFSDLLPQYYRSGEINFKVRDPQKLLKLIEKKYKKTATKISHLDGLKMEFQDYWFNLRPSNTEPLIRLNVEALSQKTLKNKVKEIKALLRHN